MSERIATRCPACHNSTLVIGGGNWLACSLIGCPDPTRINSVGDRADSHFDDLQTLRDERDRLARAIVWALGYTDFRAREQGEGAYWWRTELRLRAKLTGEQIDAILAALTPAGGGQDE